LCCRRARLGFLCPPPVTPGELVGLGQWAASGAAASTENPKCTWVRKSRSASNAASAPIGDHNRAVRERNAERERQRLERTRDPDPDPDPSPGGAAQLPQRGSSRRKRKAATGSTTYHEAY